MYPVASSQNAPRRDERRRNPRHTASAIVYVHLGPDNGGIIINLGIDGVACQAARKLTAKINSTLNVRLRGSGLDVNLVGEIVWQGATQKEIGICFKDPPAGQQQEIANWIAQQEQPSKASEFDDLPPLKPLPPMPGIFVPGEKFVPDSQPAALSTPPAIPATSPSSAVADATDSRLPAPVDSPSKISASTPQLEIVSPAEVRNASPDGWAARAQSRNADLLALPEPPQTGQLFRNYPLSVPPPIEDPHQAPADDSTPIALAKQKLPPVRETLARTSTVPPSKGQSGKSEIIQTTPRDPVSPPPGSLPGVTAADRWIPPALLAAWRGGNQQEKIVLASTTSAFLLIFVLILAFVVGHISSGSRELSTEVPEAPSANIRFPQTGPLPAPESAQGTVTTDPDSDQPPPSMLERFAVTFLGYKPEKPPEVETYIRIPIDKNHVGVQVWTSKSSGYYYCTDNPYYIVVQPGIFMTQRDALQSGYQPKLGQFCN